MKKKLYVLNALLITLLLDHISPILALSADSSYFINSSLKMIWGLLIVLGILLIIYGVARKKLTFVQGGKGNIKIIETHHLMPKKTLFLVDVKGKQYLVGSGGDSLNLITPIDDTSPSFNELLEKSETKVQHEP